MLRDFNDLQRDVVADLQAQVRGHADLRDAEGARVHVVGWPDDLEGVHDRVRHVGGRDVAGAVDADVDVDKGEAVAGEPAGLDVQTAAVDGPLGAVCGEGHAAALEGLVSGVLDGGVRGGCLHGYIHCMP